MDSSQGSSSHFRIPSDEDPDETIQPLPLLDRHQILATHEATVIEDDKHLIAKEQRFRTFRISLNKIYSQRPLADLRPVDLSYPALKIDDVSLGIVLICRIVSSRVVKRTGIQFVVEDPNGLVAPVELTSYSPRITRTELDQIFPPGHYLGIKEPSFIKMKRFPYMIKTDAPMDIVQLYPSSQLVTHFKWRTPNPAPNLPNTVETLKQAGNIAFSKTQFYLALHHYSSALELEKSTSLERNPTILSNRAAVYLKLDRPKRALDDALAGLANNPPHNLFEKLSFRAACALYQLAKYTQARKYVLKFPENEPCQELLCRIDSRIRESTKGIYRWKSMFETAKQHPDEPLDVASYIGKMFKQTPIVGKGNGLVATRDIKRGELLMLCKPIVYGFPPSTKTLEIIHGSNHLTQTKDPTSFVDLLNQLVVKAGDDEEVAEKIGSMYPGDVYAKSNEKKAWNAFAEGVDIDRIEGVTTFNAFIPKCIASTLRPEGELHPEEPQDLNNVPCALYFEPSFINHSCIGNVTYSFLGDVIFVYSKSFIHRGEEIVDSYVDPLLPYTDRTSKLSKHAFLCPCVLCIEDRKIPKDILEKRQAQYKKMQGLADVILSNNKSPKEALRLFKESQDLLVRLENAYEGNTLFRPECYMGRRVFAQVGGFCKEHTNAIFLEKRALESLGAIVSPTDEMTVLPKLGESYAVLSCLFIAQQYKCLGNPKKSKLWMKTARTIEQGQTGNFLFEKKYQNWAREFGVYEEMRQKSPTSDTK